MASPWSSDTYFCIFSFPSSKKPQLFHLILVIRNFSAFTECGIYIKYQISNRLSIGHPGIFFHVIFCSEHGSQEFRTFYIPFKQHKNGPGSSEFRGHDIFSNPCGISLAEIIPYIHISLNAKNTSYINQGKNNPDNKNCF